MNDSKKHTGFLSIFDRDTLLHLRLPFSFFLLPVFCFGISQASVVCLANTIIVFIALHLFIYPGSNIYNSYMDKDTGSIGGLKNPPPVTRKLYYASIIFDVAGLGLCAFSGWRNMVLLAVYVAFSKAYSWHSIRLKKYPYISWLVITVFQGGYTFMLASMAAENNTHLSWFTTKNVVCMVIASVLIGGSYPLTQLYQHEADSSRGDYTISYRLGITGTFIFTLASFIAGAGLLFYYFYAQGHALHFFIFSVCLAPVMGYFLNWFYKAAKDKKLADFEHVMLMNKISAWCMVICFTVLIFLNHAIMR